MTAELAFRHTMVHLNVHLPPTESPMTTELAFRHANDGTPLCLLTSYRISNDGVVSLPTRQRRYISVHTYKLQKIQRRRVSQLTCQ